MDVIVFVTIFLMVVGIGIIIGRFAIVLEKDGFNKGICPKCGKKLRLFDYDSQNGRCYVCECGYNTWVSYDSVDKKYGEEKEKNNG